MANLQNNYSLRISKRIEDCIRDVHIEAKVVAHNVFLELRDELRVLSAGAEMPYEMAGIELNQSLETVNNTICEVVNGNLGIVEVNTVSASKRINLFRINVYSELIHRLGVMGEKGKAAHNCYVQRVKGTYAGII